MNTRDVTIPQLDAHKLLTCGNPDAVLLYLFLRSDNPAFEAAAALNMNAARYSRAVASLRQIGLWLEDAPTLRRPMQAPAYTEEDVVKAMKANRNFPMLVDDLQRVLGRYLTTEELKTILSFLNYLGLPAEVISMLVCHCKERARAKGSNRNPSLRSIEKEAYAWADHGINTMEEAAAFMQADNARHSRMAGLMNLLHIHGRPLTAAEEHFAESWLSMNFDTEALEMAYEKTCVNTGGMKWPYMNRILMSWHQQDLHTGAQIRQGDRKPTARNAANAAQVQRAENGTAALGSFEKDAIARMMREQNQEG